MSADQGHSEQRGGQGQSDQAEQKRGGILGLKDRLAAALSRKKKHQEAATAQETTSVVESVGAAQQAGGTGMGELAEVQAPRKREVIREGDQVRVGPVRVIFDNPPSIVDLEDEAEQTVNLLAAGKDTPDFPAAEISVEHRQQLQETFNLGTEAIIAQCRDLGIDFDPSNIPDFSQVEFVQRQLNNGDFYSGGHYNLTDGRIQIFVRPGESPLVTAMHMVHELRHASSTNTLYMEWLGFGQSIDPSLYRWSNGLAATRFTDIYNAPKVQQDGIFMDNALSLDFQQRMYAQVAAIFPEEAKAREELLQRGDSLLTDLERFSTLAPDEIRQLALPFVEESKGGLYIDSRGLTSLLILKAIYRKSLRDGETSTQFVLENDSLGRPTNMVGGQMRLVNLLGRDRANVLWKMHDYESLDELFIQLGHVEGILE